MKLINKGLAVLVALALYDNQTAYAKGNIEFRADKNYYVSDMNNHGTIYNRIGYFARHIQSSDYIGNTNGFTLVDVNFKVNSGLDMVVDNQFSESGANVKTGILTTSNLGQFNLSLGILADLGIKPTKKHELNLFCVYEKDKTRLNSEIYTNFGNNGNLNSVNGRINIGYKITENLVLGVFGQEILSREHKSFLESRAGLFLRINP